MDHSPCFFLVSHGSRDRRSLEGLTQRVEEISVILRREYFPRAQVFRGVLELGDEPLHRQIVQAIVSRDCPPPSSVRILPLFLQPGTHVLVDIPREVALAQTELQHFADGLKTGNFLETSFWFSTGVALSSYFSTYPYLGADPTIVDWLRPQLDPAYPWICIAHGSSRPESQDTFTQLHQALGTIPAYLQHPPFLTETIDRLLLQGTTRIGILPYFLFPGRLTDTIAATLQTLGTQYPSVQYHCLPLLGQQPDFPQRIVEILRRNTERN